MLNYAPFYSRTVPVSVRYVESSRLPTAWGVFDIHGFEDPDANKEHVVLTMGDVGSGASTPSA